MYKYTDHTQSSFLDFNQPIGLHMNPENRWVKMADAIPWEIFEKKYSRLFKGKNGRVAKPLRLAFGSLIIQTNCLSLFMQNNCDYCHKKYSFSIRIVISEFLPKRSIVYFFEYKFASIHCLTSFSLALTRRAIFLISIPSSAIERAVSFFAFNSPRFSPFSIPSL